MAQDTLVTVISPSKMDLTLSLVIEIEMLTYFVFSLDIKYLKFIRKNLFSLNQMSASYFKRALDTALEM